LAKVILKKNEEHRILSGHQWVFSNEIETIDADINTGALVDVYSSKDIKLGSGFYNKNSLISLRILGKSFSGDLSSYIIESINKAFNYRKSVYPNRLSYRIVFSESDFLPGLIIDKYNDSFVLQVYCAGIQKNIELVTEILKNEFQAKNIFTLNDPYFRKLEGLDEKDEVFLGESGTEKISDGKITYNIDFSSTQKTGFYFDQSDNREFIEKLSCGKTVLDAFCNSGGFGMHAAYAGAGFVMFVDSSKKEIENARRNYSLNNLNAEAGFEDSDVFDYFEKCINAGRKFDVVIADPPAFAKSRKSIPTALKGYIKLNKLALSCLKESGYLVTSSCSHHINEQDFLDSINKSAQKAGKNIQLIYKNGASLDHPRIPAMPETVYLKFLVFKVS